ncbi:MAG: iron uptake porin [Microcystaceae cyanobacterium]
MKNLVIKTIRILPLILSGLGMGLPAAMSQTHFVNAEDLSVTVAETTPSKVTEAQVSSPFSDRLNPDSQELLQQIQRVRQPKGFHVNNHDLSQVTNVNELRDVEPTAWAYEALKSLVERYGCIVGYPDRTFRGNRALSRWEFAAGLNACMNTLERLLQENVAVLREDLDKLKRLAQDFSAELVAIGARVDNLESRISYLEDHQFSTTTKLFGVATMYIAGAAGSQTAASYIPNQDGVTQIRPSQDLADQTVMQYSTLLSLNTSFSGTDSLSVDLWTSNVTPFSSPIFGFTPNVTGTFNTRLSFDAPPYNNSLAIADLIYKFQPVENLSVFIDAVGGEVSGELLYSTQPFTVFAPYTISISRFGRFDPIYYQTLARPGVAANYKLSDQISLGAGFYGDYQAGNPEIGLFNGGNAAIAQLSLFPTDTLGMTLVYVRSYNKAGPFVGVSGQTGSLYADQPFGTTFVPPAPGAPPIIPTSIATSADHVTWGFGWRAMPTLALTGDVGVAFAHAEQDNPTYGVVRGDGATLFEWNLGLSLIDLFGEGNIGSLMVGNPYRVVQQGSGFLKPESDTAWHIEAAYKYNFNNNISIQPGFLVVLNPENNNSNPAIWVWQLKTQYMF